MGSKSEILFSSSPFDHGRWLWDRSLLGVVSTVFLLSGGSFLFVTYIFFVKGTTNCCLGMGWRLGMQFDRCVCTCLEELLLGEGMRVVLDNCKVNMPEGANRSKSSDTLSLKPSHPSPSCTQ